jgi:HlyD family secretion protein
MDRKIKKKKWPPKRIAIVSVGVIFFSVILYSLIFGDRSSKLNVDLERITISTVSRGDFQEFIPVIGRVAPIYTHYLVAEEGGRVEKKFIESGTSVKEGDPILQLANTNLLMDIMWREAELYQASNNLRTARLMMEQNMLNLRRSLADLDYEIRQQKRLFDRNQQLMEKNLISQEEYDQVSDQYEHLQKKRDLTVETMKQDSLFRQIQIDQLEASLSRMESNLLIVKQKQDNLLIRAPLTGMLTSLQAEIGESKSQGQPLGQIDVLDDFKVEADVDEHYIARVEKGRYGTFPFAGDTNKLVVSMIYLEVVNGAFKVDLQFLEEEPEGIRRGMTVHIRLELGDLEEAVLLPKGGFYQKTGGQWVYVIDESGAFAYKKSIRLGRQNPQVFTVLEGLEPGERVITSSYDSFGDIDKLILRN